MKQACLILCLLAFVEGYSQKEITAYVELKGDVDIFGNVEMELPKVPQQPDNAIDSLIDYKAISSVFTKRNNISIKIINALSLQGWTLSSTVYAEKASMVFYYFKHTFTLSSTQ